MANIDSLDVLHVATGRGIRSSEFWLTLAVIVAVLLHPTTWWTAGAVSVSAAAYVISRGVVKAATSRALLTPTDPPLSLAPDRSTRPIR